MNDQLTLLEPCDISKTIQCNVCFDDIPAGPAHSVSCCMCHNFTMCIPCFNKFILIQDAILYAHVHRAGRDLSTKCPYCQAGNGFAYWSIIYRNYPQMPEKDWLMAFSIPTTIFLGSRRHQRL
jgi:hypothetical protein